jgi:hypothetical protein
MFSGHTLFDASGMIVNFVYIQGQKRVVQPADCLGLVLVWMRTRGALNVLQLVFGLTYFNLSVYLQFGIQLIVETFHNDPLARLAIPLREEIKTFKVAFSKQHSLLNDCWATMDGLKLYLQASGNLEIQEKFYNGWMHDHYVTSVFCFCPNGTIPIAFFNVPGCVHDSQVVEFGKIHDKLEDIHCTMGGKRCVDSAFGSINRRYLYKSCQDHLGSKEPIRLRSLVRYMANWRMFIVQQVGSAALTWHLGALTGRICKNLARTIWVPKNQCVGRGKLAFRKKDGSVGNAHNAAFFPQGEG